MFLTYSIFLFLKNVFKIIQKFNYIFQIIFEYFHNYFKVFFETYLNFNKSL